MDCHALLAEVRGKLPPGQIFIGNSDCTSNAGPRELFEAIQTVQDPLAYPSQAHIIVAYRGDEVYQARL